MVSPNDTETQFAAKGEGVAWTNAKLCAHVRHLPILPLRPWLGTFGCHDHPVLGIGESVGVKKRITSDFLDLGVRQIGVIAPLGHTPDEGYINLLCKLQCRFGFTLFRTGREGV